MAGRPLDALKDGAQLTGAPDHTLAHFEVSDIGAVIRELEGHGVGFVDYAEGPLQTTGHIAQLGLARAAWLHDPDGNTLGLRQS